MGIIRVSKDRDNPYVVLNKTCLDDVKLSWQAKGLHSYLISKPDQWKIYVNDLYKRSKNGRDATANILKELIENGYVTRKPCRDSNTNKMLGGYDYQVYEIPLENPQKLKSRKTDFPETGIPGNRVSRKPENTELVSNDFKVSNDVTTIVINEQPQQDKTVYIKKYFEKYIGVITPNNFLELLGFLDDGMEVDVIIRAIDEATSNGVKNYRYIKTILNNWIEVGIKTNLDLTEYQNEYKKKKRKSNSLGGLKNDKQGKRNSQTKSTELDFNSKETRINDKELERARQALRDIGVEPRY